MVIAVDTRFLQSDEMPELREFTKEVFTRLAAQHPEHAFIFFIDDKADKETALLNNISTVVLTPKPVNFLLYKWWYDVKVSRALKKNKASLFIATYGLGSLTTAIPQILIIRDLSFLEKPAYFPFNSFSFYKKYIPYFIKKSKAVVALSSSIKQQLVNLFKMKEEEVYKISGSVNKLFKPIEWHEKELIKEQYAAGCEYFVFTGGLYAVHNLLHVLKAFSIFKKWQKTNMKLVIITGGEVDFEKVFNKIQTYKYRNEIFIRNDTSLTQKASIVAAAYAMIFPSFYDGFATPVIEAMKCGVPVITADNTSMMEIAANAALYADPANPKAIADQMKKIFKDEQMRSELIEAGKQRVDLFDWDKTAAALYTLVEQIVCK